MKTCPTCNGSGVVPETVRGAFVVEDDRDDAPTLRIPPVRESIGPRRRPPAPMVAELSERVDLLRALVDELAGYDDDQADATPCGSCGHPRFSHSDDGRFCGTASCPCSGFLVPLVAP